MGRMGNRSEILDEEAYVWMPQKGKGGGFYTVNREALAKKVDFVGTATIYRAWGTAGALGSESKWAVQRITFTGADDDMDVEWADGDVDFDNVWDNRASLSYT